ncbi:hypothetical protein ACFL0Q_01775 [Thermodesulfobacteriota bacterium]
MKALGVEEDSTLPYLLELLSVKDSGFDQINMSPEGKRHQTIEALKRIALKGSELRPLVMAIEDLHWADKSSEDSLKYLLESIAGSRIFLVLTYRPEFVATWSAKTYHNQVTLNRLSNRESLAMVSHLFGTEDIDSALQELVLEKTEGIPFFIEELIKSLKEMGIVQKKDNRYGLSMPYQEIAVPGTIQDVIMARVDALPEGAKEVLQTGSVIEREFTHELIQRVTGHQEQELLRHMSVIKDAELLYERGVYPRPTYIFKHALTRDVVYDSVLAKRKKELHGLVGGAIEELYKDHPDEQFGVLAEHYIEAGNWDVGAKHSQLAARQAHRKGARTEAVSYGEKAVLCVEKQQKTDGIQRKIIDARTDLANYYLNLTLFAKARDAVAPIKDLVLEIGHQKSLPTIYNAIGCDLLYIQEDFSRGIEYMYKALDVAERAENRQVLFNTHTVLATELVNECQFENALEHSKKLMTLSSGWNFQNGVALAKSIDARSYLTRGQLDSAYHIAQEGLNVARTGGDIFFIANCQWNIGLTCYHKGLFAEAEDHLLGALADADRIDWALVVMGISNELAEMYCHLGQLENTQLYCKKGISSCESFGICPSAFNYCKIILAQISILMDDRDMSLENIFEYHNNVKPKFMMGRSAHAVARILLTIGGAHLSDAEVWINAATEIHERNGMRWYLAQDYAVYSELFKRKGEQSKAKENLTKAIEIMNECGADGWVTRYEEELARL